MRFSNQINWIKDNQSKMVAVQKEIRASCKKLERDIRRIVAQRLKEAFPTVTFIDGDWLVGVDGGSMTDKWTPEVYFYSINGNLLSKEGFWFEETFEKFQKIEPPVNTKEFLVFLKEMSKELGVRCRFYRHEPHMADKVAVAIDSEYGGDDL